MAYDLHSKFDIEEHAKHYYNYLEVIIDETGEIHYAVPSHQEKLIQLACDRLKVTRNRLSALCPAEYYFDFTKWLCMITDCVSVWTDFIVYGNDINKKQWASLQRLHDANLYKGVNIYDGPNLS